MNGDWEPAWIGPPSSRLYAAFHAVTGAANVGVVIAPPLFHEQPRSRRFIAEMAADLARQGVPCLRFDYHGTGDSTGTGDDTDFTTLRRDLSTAVAALRRKASVRRVCLLAWRASALPLQGWTDDRVDVDLIVLWEPIVDGAEWLRRLGESDARERAVRPPGTPGGARSSAESDGQLMGFRVSSALRQDLRDTRLHEAASLPCPVWSIVRKGSEPLPMPVAKSLVLPDVAPTFNDEVAMDATFFLTPQVRDVVRNLCHGLQTQVAA